MPGPHLLLTVATLSVGIVTVIVALVWRQRSTRLETRLTGDDPTSAGVVVDHDPAADVWQEGLRQSATVRLLQPMLDRAGELVRGLLPRARVAQIRRTLVQAGVAGKITAEEFVTLQVVAVVVGAVAALLFWDGTARGGALSLLLVVIGLLAPRALLDRRRSERVEAIQGELPDVLDLLAISVEAGQGLEGALATVAERDDGVLATELRHTLQEMELGITRRRALENLRDRTGVPDVAGLVAALIQADVLGTPVGDVLHTQATEQRRRRRAQVREAAAKLPVKMLLPLVMFILPALFIVILGPAAMDIAAMFDSS